MTLLREKRRRIFLTRQCVKLESRNMLESKRRFYYLMKLKIPRTGLLHRLGKPGLGGDYRDHPNGGAPEVSWLRCVRDEYTNRLWVLLILYAP